MLLTAEAHQARGDTAGLRAALEEATALDPNIGGAQLQLAGIYATAGEHDKAIERYRIILKRHARLAQTPDWRFKRSSKVARRRGWPRPDRR